MTYSALLIAFLCMFLVCAGSGRADTLVEATAAAHGGQRLACAAKQCMQTGRLAVDNQ